ncbi:hypothetical protein B0H12DRAFT_1070273 [Mycena haematopus]|nr:hypothetical protein B0H12DRAFT_1070273 [Mycena haematopus]
MPSTPSNTLAPAPTLILVPSFVLSEEPDVPALAPIPVAATAALAKIVNAAPAIRSENSEVAVANVLRPTPSALLLDDDDVLDLDLEAFFAPGTPDVIAPVVAQPIAPQAKGKGKAKELAPTPTRPIAQPAAQPVVAGSSSSKTRSTLDKLGIKLADKPQRWTTAHHNSRVDEHNALTMITAAVHDEVAVVKGDLREGLAGAHTQLVDSISLIPIPGLQAQLVGYRADAADAISRAGYDIDPSLVEASNRQSANATIMGNAINGVYGRLRNVEASLSALEASMDSHTSTLQLVLNRTGAGAGTATAAPSSDTAFLAGLNNETLRSVVQEMINANGKRVRFVDGDVDEPAKHHHVAAAPAVVIPPVFTLPTAPAAPVYAAPVVTLPTAPAAPAYATPFVPPSYPTAPPSTGLMPTSALPTAPVPSTGLPHAPPGGPPRVRVDPAREVLFGPMNWEGKWNRNPLLVINNVISQNTMRAARFVSRRGADDSIAVLVFDADAHAAWFIGAWNASSRVGYEVCVARPMPLNT